MLNWVILFIIGSFYDAFSNQGEDSDTLETASFWDIEV